MRDFGYTYDALGRMTELKDGEGNRTLFTYDSLGRLVQKTYADNSFYSYGYNPRGWLTNRIDALGHATAYEYDNAGQLTRIDYPTDTDVVFSYDLLGRQTNRTDSAGTWNLAYDGESSRALSETLTSVSSVLSVVNYAYASNTYDLAAVSCGSSTTLYSWSQGRLTNITSQVGTNSLFVRYSYLPDADLLSEISNPAFEVHRSYDGANRLTAITNLAGTNLISSFTYALDSVGRRTQRDDADGSRLNYGYDQYDQLTSAIRTNGPNPAADAAYRFNYQYDEVGNRLHEDRGLLDLDGTFNPLNQLTHLGFAGKLDVVGAVAGTNGPFTVKVDGENASIFNGTNFHGGGRVKVGTNVISVVSTDAFTNRTSQLRRATFPPTNPQQFTWDLNGNMTSDGQRTFTWNEENKLIAIETVGTNSLFVRKRSEFAYDAQSRRIGKVDYSGWTNGAYSVTNTTRFTYDGWNLVSELITDNGSLITNNYMWGLDLSQSLQGAGGIGGLLAVIRTTTNGTATYFPCYDGNGNISDYVDTNGVVVAHREYDPFGNTVVSTGPLKDAFSFWFSTKYYEPTWNLYYYGYRYYSPSMGRWLSRDPVGEMGGLNLYLHSRNNPIMLIDPLGKSVWDIIQIIPGLGTLYNLIVSPTGSHDSDYTINIDACLCKTDASEAMRKCKADVDLQAAGYLGTYWALNIPHEVIDAFAGFIHWGFWVDAVVDLYLSLWKSSWIDDAGNRAKNKCVCP